MRNKIKSLKSWSRALANVFSAALIVGLLFTVVPVSLASGPDGYASDVNGISKTTFTIGEHVYITNGQLEAGGIWSLWRPDGTPAQIT
ncbi:MAG: hypothetical protein Q8Q06_00115, partial [bacterium]|nr:hypothetical protein [bacterium]